MGYFDKKDPLNPLMSPTLVNTGKLPPYNETLKAMSGSMPDLQTNTPTGSNIMAPNNPQKPSGLMDMLGNLGGMLSDNSDLINKIGAGYFALNQDPRLQQFGMAKIQEMQKQKAANKSKNQTVAALMKAGRKDLAQAVESGMLPATEAAKMLYSGGDMKIVGKSAIRYNPVTGEAEVLYTDQGGSDEATAAFRTLEARAEAAGLKKGTPEYTQFMIDGGSKSGFAIRTTPDGGFEFVQGGASLKPLNEFQSKATGFYGRMTFLSPIIDKYEQQGTQLFDSIVKGIPIAGNYLTSPEYKQYMYAKDNWIAAQLRDESGAAIGTDEYANADKQYFPQVGDTPEVIEQKRQLRKKAEEAMKTKAGKGVEGSEDTPAPKSIKIGDVVNGYRYKGGDPKQESSWEKI